MYRSWKFVKLNISVWELINISQNNVLVEMMIVIMDIFRNSI